MSGLCSTCRHWAPPSERTGYGNVVGFWDDFGERHSDEADERADHDDRLFGLCRAIDLGTDLPMSRETPLAVTKDASDYCADLFTQAEFGCAMHEPAAQPGDGGDAAAGGGE